MAKLTDNNYWSCGLSDQWVKELNQLYDKLDIEEALNILEGDGIILVGMHWVMRLEGTIAYWKYTNRLIKMKGYLGSL